MSLFKIIAILVLLSLAFHLLLFGYMKRRIAIAKYAAKQVDVEQDKSPLPQGEGQAGWNHKR